MSSVLVDCGNEKAELIFNEYGVLRLVRLERLWRSGQWLYAVRIEVSDGAGLDDKVRAEIAVRRLTPSTAVELHVYASHTDLDGNERATALAASALALVSAIARSCCETPSSD